MSSTDIVVNRPSTTLTVAETPNNLFNYFNNKEIDANNSSSSSSTSSSTILTTTTAPTTTTSSNASSNSSSFIQLSNDDTLENGSPQAEANVTSSTTPKIMIKNRKLVKKKKKKIEINNNKFILNAFVNGFAQLKLSADKIDYEYIIEIYWSNSMKTFIKRTYDDFVLFHRKLMQIFNKNNNIEQQQQQQPQEKVIPTLPGKLKHVSEEDL